MRVGETVGDYTILEELGRGAVGRVFRVEHVLTRRQEAMKVLAGVSVHEPEVAHRFLREIRVQASLNHPQIAAVHNAFCVNERLVMVMELVEGKPLSSLMERGELEWREGIRIIRQVLSALSYAHAKGVIHRDISPANIIVGLDGRIKITDFGLACAVADLRMSLTGSVVGSAYYMAPEQVRGADQTEARSDLYSCGAVLYEAVTRRKPFPGVNAFDVMQAHLMTAPTPPVEFNRALPMGISDAILKAMSKAPEERFATAAEFLEDLARVMMPPGMAAKEKRMEPASNAPVRKQRWITKASVPVYWALGLALGVLIASLLSLGSLAFQKETQAGEDTAAVGEPALPAAPAPESADSPAETPAQEATPVADAPPAAVKYRRKAVEAQQPLIYPASSVEHNQWAGPPKAAGVLPPPSQSTALLPLPKLEGMPASQAPLTDQSWESAAPLMQSSNTPLAGPEMGRAGKFLKRVRSLNPFRRRQGQEDGEGSKAAVAPQQP